MKGYLTVYLALSLGILAGFILMLTNHAIQKAGKIRLECAADTSMNAVLSEFSVNLFERYDLLYTDISYLGREPSVSNLEERLRIYLLENTGSRGTGRQSYWGGLNLQKIFVGKIETAAADGGASMRNQAIIYVEDAGSNREESDAADQIEAVLLLDGCQPMEEWSALMEHIAGMELPVILNQEGRLQEVPLSNPADWVYGLSGNDLLYLGKMNMQAVGSAELSLSQYLSHRELRNTESNGRKYRREKQLFLTYLFEKLGYYGAFCEDTLLNCQIEYVAAGQSSDWKNLKMVVERIFRWRFADNAALALSDAGLRKQAQAAAGELHAVQLKEEFKEPTAESMLYACAFLESICDIRILFSGGRVPLQKSEHSMQIGHLLSGRVYQTGSQGGWSYSQYLAAMLLLISDEEWNFRVMDIMEMDIRMLEGNRYFAMDWCVERFEAEISAQNSCGSHYTLRRKYGYF